VRARVTIAAVRVAGAALAFATGCISPPAFVAPEVEPHEVSFVATDDALAVLGDVPVLFGDDAWVGAVDARAIHPPALRGGYLIGGDGACPLPADVREYTLDEGVGFVPGARRIAPWIQRPEVAPLAFEISSTCGSGRDPWLLSGNACGFVVSSADPSWARRAFGLRDVRAPELLDPEGRCVPIASTGRAIASAECSDRAPSCHVDLFPPEPQHPFKKSAPLVDVDFQAFSRRVAVATVPFPAALKGLALHGGWLRTLAMDARVATSTAVAVVPPSCVPQAILRSLDPETLEEASAIPLPAPYSCGVAVFTTSVAPALYALARRDTPAAVGCRDEPGVSPDARDWAILRLTPARTFQVVAELGAPCASRSMIGRPMNVRAPLLIGLVQDALPSTGRPGETWLAPFDAVLGRLSAQTTTAGRELATLLPTRSARAWLTYERGGGFTSFVLGPESFTSRPVEIIAQIPFGNRGPSGFTGFDSGHVAAWFDRRSGDVAAWVTDDSADTQTKVIVVGASWAPQEVSAIVPDWPPDEAARDTTRGLGLTITAAADERRAVTLRPFERLSSVRARHRGVIAEVGRGPADPETLVLDDGALVLVLGWEATVVRVEPRPR
jgi:hypothetical protein